MEKYILMCTVHAIAGSALHTLQISTYKHLYEQLQQDNSLKCLQKKRFSQNLIRILSDVCGYFICGHRGRVVDSGMFVHSY